MSQTCLTYTKNINGTHFDNRQIAIAIAIDDLCDQVEQIGDIWLDLKTLVDGQTANVEDIGQHIENGYLLCLNFIDPNGSTTVSPLVEILMVDVI